MSKARKGDRNNPKASLADRDRVPDIIRRMLIALVAERRDLTMRQMAIFLTFYLSENTVTTGQLSKDIGMPVHAIYRGLSRLAKFQMLSWEIDSQDRRSLSAGRTAEGNDFMNGLRIIAMRAARSDGPSDGSRQQQEPPIIA